MLQVFLCALFFLIFAYVYILQGSFKVFLEHASILHRDYVTSGDSKSNVKVSGLNPMVLLPNPLPANALPVLVALSLVHYICFWRMYQQIPNPFLCFYWIAFQIKWKINTFLSYFCKSTFSFNSARIFVYLDFLIKEAHLFYFIYTVLGT